MTDLVPPEGLAAWRAVLFARAAIVEETEERFAQLGLIPFDWYDVLVAIATAPGGRLRLRDLGAAMVTSRSGVTRLVDRLERAGLVRREPCAEDRRGLNAVITTSGRTALRRAWPEYARVIRERFLANLGEAELKAVTSTLEKVQHGARQAPAVAPRDRVKDRA